MLFKIIYGLDVIVAVIIFYFFITGIGDGTVSSYNAVLWLVIIAALTAILWGSIWLKSHESFNTCTCHLIILAIPAILFELYFLIAVTGNGRWN